MEWIAIAIIVLGVLLNDGLTDIGKGLNNLEELISKKKKDEA